MSEDKKDKKTAGGEPFPADKTPNPPQQMEPVARERNTNSPEAQDEQKDKDKKPSKETKEEKPKLLGETPIQIDDETTI